MYDVYQIIIVYIKFNFIGSSTLVAIFLSLKYFVLKTNYLKLILLFYLFVFYYFNVNISCVSIDYKVIIIYAVVIRVLFV